MTRRPRYFLGVEPDGHNAIVGKLCSQDNKIKTIIHTKWKLPRTECFITNDGLLPISDAEERQTIYYKEIEVQRYKPTGGIVFTGREIEIDLLIYQVVAVIPHFLEHEVDSKVSNSVYG